MNKPKRKRRHSFRSVLSISMLICWILPIVIISTAAGMLLNFNYNRNLRRSTNAEFAGAMWQVETRLSYALDDAVALSADGVISSAYRAYGEGIPVEQMYRSVLDYLNRKFSRNESYRGVFLHYLDADVSILPYVIPPRTQESQLLNEYHSRIQPSLLEQAEAHGAGEFLTVINQRLFLVRTLAEEEPYAVGVLELEISELVQPLYSLSRNGMLELTIDGIPIPLGIETDTPADPNRVADISRTGQVGEHTLVCTGQIIGLNIWTSVPMLRWIVFSVLSLVVPMLAIIIALFYRNINHPISILIDAYSRIQEGQRGYQIHQKAPNSEFSLLYQDFNAMSCELDSQFKRLYEEQQALQQAKIKALQSQINPHFLNNTLEIINWEARLAENDRVCTMIEALGTMLDAAIGRDGRSQVLLSEELKYVEAYLHITKERLGDRLTIRMDVAPETLECIVPLLILQPILENAVEYDLSRTGGELSLHTFLEGSVLHLEVEHDGYVTAEGWARIRAGLQADTEPAVRVDGRSVGIRNVANRLALIYGGCFCFDIREVRPGRILAEIVLNMDRSTNTVKNKQELS